MTSYAYIGLFRTFPNGKWQVRFPDLPGCGAEGSSFKEALEEAGAALRDHLLQMEDAPPRPRSTAELMIDGQRDWALARMFVDSVMHHVRPSGEQHAPLELVASQSRSAKPQVRAET